MIKFSSSFSKEGRLSPNEIYKWVGRPRAWYCSHSWIVALVSIFLLCGLLANEWNNGPSFVFVVLLLFLLPGVWVASEPLRSCISYKLMYYHITSTAVIIEVRMLWFSRIYSLSIKEISRIIVTYHKKYYSIHFGFLSQWWRFMLSGRGGYYWKDYNINGRYMDFEFHSLSRLDCDMVLSHFPPGIINVWSEQENQYMQWSKFCYLGYDSNWANET